MPAMLLLAASPPALAAQKVYEIKLVHQSETLYRFDPGTVTARAGDILQFTVSSGGPYLVAFQPTEFTPSSRARMVAAIPGGNAELRFPALSKPGERARITLPPVPPGSYRFYSVTHVAYRMAGTLIVR